MGCKRRMLFCITSFGPTTVRDALGSIVNFSGGDPWYNVTIANNTKYFENSDYYYSRLTAGVDFRAKNLEAFDNLRKKFIRSLCICKKFIFTRQKKKNSKS